MPPSSSSSSSSSQFWSDPHGLQQQQRRRGQFQLSGGGVHSGGKIGDFAERREEAHESVVGENVHVRRVARGLLGKEEGEGEFSSTVLTTSRVGEAAASAAAAAVDPSSQAADRPARGPSWRRSLTPPVSPWPIRHWWAQGWTTVAILSANRVVLCPRKFHFKPFLKFPSWIFLKMFVPSLNCPPSYFPSSTITSDPYCHPRRRRHLQHHQYF